MPATIKIKNSSTASAVPTSSDLVQGELAVNVTDKRLFTENASGTVVELGTNPTILTMGAAGSASAPVITRTGDTNTGIFFPAADTIAFAEGGVEALRLDSSGNAGLGVTPSAWSGFTASQVKNGSVASTGNDVFLNANCFFNGASWRYVATAAASQFYEDSGSFIWRTAGSGTAGNQITFTQAMTLDASGNLGVGSTSPNLGGVNKAITLNSATSTNCSYELAVNGVLQGSLYTGIGTTSVNLFSWVNGPLVFGTNSSERARIDSSGNLLVGTTSGQNGGSTFSGLLTSYRATSTTSNAVFLVSSDVGGTANVNFRVLASGNAQNTNNSYGAISDVKLKENITNATPKLAQLNQVRVVNYNLIGDANKQLGVIAQELEQIFPNMVEETADKDSEGNDLGTTTKSVKYSVFVPMLIKALQELKAEFDAYKASHP